MARSSRKVTLGNGAEVNPNLNPSVDTPNIQDTTTMADVQQAFDPNLNPSPLQAPGSLPQDEPDEDLVISRNSPIKDKRKAYEKEIRRLGREYATSALSTWGLAETLLEGTLNGAFTIAELPNGTKQDDALDMYRVFRMPDRGAKPVVENNSFNSNVAMYRNIVTLGMIHQNDNVQKWFGKVKDIYENAPADLKKSFKNFRGTFEAVSDVVREQLARDTKAQSASPLLSDGLTFNSQTNQWEQTGPNEIENAMRKAIPDADDAVKYLIIARKALGVAFDGRASKVNPKNNFSGIRDAGLSDLIVELDSFVKTQLDPTQAGAYNAATVKQKRQRRVIGKVPTGAPIDTTQTDQDDQQDETPDEDFDAAMQEANK